MSKKSRITTLWDLISVMQSTLERRGLEDDAVDAAVVCGVESMLAPDSERLRKRLERRKSALLLAPWRPVTAKA